jgi:phage-related protein
MSVGELFATFDLDPDPARRAIAQAEIAMRGLQRDTDGRVRDMQGRFVSLGRSLDEVSRHTDRTGDSGRRAERDLSRLGGLSGPIRGLGSALGSAAGQAGMAVAQFGAAVPVVAGVAAALVDIVPAAAIAATALLSVAQAAAVIKIGTAGVGGALSAAFSDAGKAAGGAAGGARKLADAQRAVKDATEQAAYANKQAAQQVAQAERNLSDAQRAALQAQKDLNDARKQAARDLEDMNNNLADAQLSQRQAILDVQDAQKNLDAVKAKGANASAEELAQAQLQYDEAVQRLKEQQLETQRLSDDTAAANRAGVEGSQTVRDAQDRVAQSQRDVQDRTRDVQDAQEQMARTAKQGLENIQKAQEALTQAVGGSAGGVDQLAQALAKLSPNARAFVQAIIAMKPQLDALRLDVQDRLFAGLAARLTSTAKSVLPVFRRELVSSAGALNDMAKGALASAKELADNGTLGRAMGSASKGLHNLSGIPGIVVTAFGQLAAAAGPAFDRLTKAAGSVAKLVGDALGKAFKSGALQDAIEQAVHLIGELVQVGLNVGKILMSIFKAADQQGGSFLDTLKTITGALAKAFDDPGVQAGLRALFSTMSTLASTAAPLLIEALDAIGPVLAALGPPAQTLIKALGQALQPIIAALGPVLVSVAGAVGALVTALAPLLTVAGQLIAAVLPALIPLFDGLTEVFQQAAPLVAELGQALLTLLTPVLAQLPNIIKPLVGIFTTLTGALLPVLTQLIVALEPSLGQIAEAFVSITTALAPVIEQIGVLIADGLKMLTPLLAPLIGLIGQLTAILAGELAKQINTIVVPALRMISQFLKGDFSGAFGSAKQVVGGVASYIVDVFVRLPNQVFTALGQLAIKIGQRAYEAAYQLQTKINEGIHTALTWLGQLPGKAVSALGALGSRLFSSGASLLQGFIDGIWSKLSSVKNAVSGVLDSVAGLFPHSPAKEGPFSGRGWVLYSGRAIGEAMAAGVRDRQGLVTAAARDLMAGARDQLQMPALAGAQQAGADLTGGGPGGAPGRGGSASSRPMQLLIDVGGERIAEVLIDPLRGEIRNRGGNVQAVLGVA